MIDRGWHCRLSVFFFVLGKYVPQGGCCAETTAVLCCVDFGLLRGACRHSIKLTLERRAGTTAVPPGRWCRFALQNQTRKFVQHVCMYVFIMQLFL